jgi:hypothetical protein
VSGDAEAEQTAMSLERLRAANKVDFFAHLVPNRMLRCRMPPAAVPRDCDTPRKPAIHETFSELSPTVDPTIMQAAGHFHNLGIVFRRVLFHLL